MALIKITGDIVESNTITGNTIATGTITTNNISSSVNLGGPKISSITYPGDDTAVDTAGGQTVILTGNGFNVGASVLLDGVAVGTVSVTNSTSISFTTPAKSAGGYIIYVVNTDGSTAVSVPGLQYSGVPSWVTAAGQIANVYETAAISNTVSATGDGSVSYSLYSGTLPPGATLAANGQLSGTSEATSSPTTYTFTIRATDAQNQDTDRTFTVTVNPDVVTWSAPANNSTITTYEYVAISNTFVSTSAAGKSITYSANVLPANVSISGATVSGTPTTVGNTTSLITATAATTGRTSTETINFVVQQDAVTWNSPANNTTYTWSQNVANTANLSATSAAGFAVSYSANVLPTGLSVSGNTITGTPTVAGNTTTLITATAATTGRTTTATFNWVINVASDPYWKNTSLLIGGTSNTISNTFINDASLNNVQLTINGDARPSKFNPYQEGYYSNYFDGTGDALTVASNTAFGFGTGDFTVELWMNIPSWTTDAQFIGCHTAFVGFDWLVQYYSANLRWLDSSLTLNAGVTPAVNQWHHFAVTRSGTTLRIFLDGTQVASGTSTANIGATKALGIMGDSAAGATQIGYVSNVRIVKGTALYTSAFTPSTSPLTAVAGTSLLTCQSNRLVDKSASNFTVIKNGDTTVSSAHPFTISNTTISSFGSSYFDGTGDYLTNSTTDVSCSGDFTFECWVYKNSSVGTDLFKFGSEASGRASIGIDTSNNLFYNFYGVGNVNLGTVLNNTWYHVAIVRSGTTVTAYVNGASTGTSTTSTTFGNANGFSLGVGMNGYLSDVRLTKGTALYTTTFTPPTAPMAAVANTKLLTLQYNGGATNNGFVDQSSFNNIITRNGNTTQGTFSPYGDSWSNYFNGSSNLAFPAGSGFTGTNFTIEGWVNISQYSPLYGAGSYAVVVCGSDNGTNGFELWIGGTSTSYTGIGFIARSGGTINVNVSQTYNFSLNTWYHVALTKSGSSYTFYVNGVSIGTSTSAGTWTDVSTLYVGYIPVGGYNEWMYGYISNLRITKGSALSISLPTTPYTSNSSTSLLTCQSPSLVDTSINNYAVTITGTPSVQKFSPFSTVTVPKYYSTYFDGTNDRLSFPSSSAFNLGTTYTVEGWIYVKSYPSELCRFIMISTNADTAGWTINLSTTGVLDCGSPSPLGAVVYQNIIGSSSVPLNTWVHFAVCRDATSARLYIGGTLYGENASPATQTSGNVPLHLGYDVAGTVAGQLNGFLSNVRIVKGTALYTTSFTPPTAALTAISNTVLLTCQSSTIVDNSTNGFAITVTGDVTPRAVSPFATTANTAMSYSPAVFGGSMYFDGTGDSLQVPSSASISGTGDYTAECWIYPTAVPGSYSVIGCSDTSGGLTMFGLNGSSPTPSGAATGSIFMGKSLLSADAYSTNVVKFNSWNHIAVTRQSGTLRMFVNGVQGTSNSSSTTNYNAGTIRIGTDGGGSALPYTGYMSDFRVIPGTALYTTNFVPSQTPATSIITGPYGALSASANIATPSVLVSGTSGGIIDYHGTNDLETVGNTQLAPQDPYGGSYYSNYFATQATENSVTSSGANITLGSGDFTVEGWFNATALADGRAGFVIGTSGTVSLYLISAGTTDWQIGTYQAPYWSMTASMTTYPAIGKWSHHAIVRRSNNIYWYINGVQVGTTSNSTTYTGTGASVGYWNSTGGWLGYISNFRVVIGTAVYTSAFTPPTEPLTAISGTQLLTCQSNQFKDNSSNAYALTRTGTVQIQSQNPFQQNTGKSLYFDGTGDVLSTSANPANSLSTGDFTVEAWVYTNTVTGAHCIAAYSIAGAPGSGAVLTGANMQWVIYQSGTNLLMRPYVSTTDYSTIIGTITIGQWTHVAMVRSGNNFYGFVNGVKSANTQSFSNALNNDAAWITRVGLLPVSNTGDEAWNGYIKDLRITKGVARYTTTFTPPTEPLMVK